MFWFHEIYFLPVPVARSVLESIFLIDLVYFGGQVCQGSFCPVSPVRHQHTMQS